MSRTPRLRRVAHLCVAVALISAALAGSARAGTLRDPIRPSQQTAFGERSHWLQPWRAYLETVPASRLRNAIGINFNVEPDEADATARLLGRSGFARARYEVGWSNMSYDDPSRFSDPGKLRRVLTAFKRNGLRPLLLLNANHGVPGPLKPTSLDLAAPAPSGARQVLLTHGSAGAVIPHLTGFNSLSDGYKAADVLITSVDGSGLATLSRPLPRDLSAGPHPGSTLRFPPFGPPTLENGSRNPLFEYTMHGWLLYVQAVTREARAVLGNDHFDVEVWNEFSFGSDFLYADRYYDPPRERGQGDVTRELVQRTAAWLRDPSHGVSHVGIADGFASQTPFAAGSTEPAGVTALSKHPYQGMVRFPADARFDGIMPLDAEGHSASVSASGSAPYRDRFVPNYDAFFPEFYLSAIKTENLVRDISPLTTSVYGTAHGRGARSSGSAPGVWITEMNLDPTNAILRVPMSPSDIEHMQAKATLRTLVSFVNKGVGAIDFFGVKGNDLALVNPRDAGGGETPRAVRRLVAAMQGPSRIRDRHQLSLIAISDRHNHKQFAGDGTAAHPPLYNRDVLGFFPFQVSARRWVVPTYVMTRNLSQTYRRRGSRFDLPAESYRITIGGLPRGPLKVSAVDPLSGRRAPARLVRKTGGRAVVAIKATDSPRLLQLAVGAGSRARR
jgi:hypothetical protein